MMAIYFAEAQVMRKPRCVIIRIMRAQEIIKMSALTNCVRKKVYSRQQDRLNFHFNWRALFRVTYALAIHCFLHTSPQVNIPDLSLNYWWK